MPTSPTTLRESLWRLAAEPHTATLRRLWLAMTPEERERGLGTALEDDRRLRASVAAAVASARHFRRQTVSGWGAQKVAAAAAHIDLSPLPGAMKAGVVGLHLGSRGSMLVQFMEAADIPHDGQSFREADFPRTEFPLKSLRHGAGLLLANYPADHVVLYFLALRTLWGQWFAGLDTLLVELAPSGPRITSDGPPISNVEATPPVGQPPVDVHGFTTLDRKLIVTVVDAAAGIEGASTIDEVDDLVLELVQLNGRRHQTFFHAGYRDALFDREPGGSLVADNEPRRLWYWAGFVNGIARRQDWAGIADLFDHERSVRELGRVSGGAGLSSAWIVFRALCELGRFGEASAFVTLDAAAGSRELQRSLLSTATDLIRRNRAAEARPMLELLWRVYAEADVEDDDRFFTDLQRRRALCLRQLGDVDEARALLDELTQRPEPSIRAVALTDIGLLKVGARRLGELSLPPTLDDLPSFIEALERGERDFITALMTPGFKSAHANFALGVLALARHWEKGSTAATAHLDDAHSIFAQSPDVYRLDGTLPNCELYLGVSICLELGDTGRLPRACDLISSGLREGARLPAWLAASTIDALSLTRSDLALETAGTILQHCGDGVLDELTSTAAAGSPAVRRALFSRAANPSRAMPARVADYRKALPLLLAAEEVGEARDALEYLEKAAFDGVGRAEFAELLADVRAYSPAWGAERAIEARVTLLEVQGRYEEAAGELESWCQRLLASETRNALDEAALLVDILGSYGPAGADAAARLWPVVEARIDRRDAPNANDASAPGDADRRLRILVVGGNEQQARMDGAIRAAVVARWPNVTVEFLHSGWSGNWSGYVDEFERRVAQADGVVFLSLMRTMFGRAVRSRCDVPWRGCARGGQGAIVRTIEAVIPFAVRYLAVRAHDSQVV